MVDDGSRDDTAVIAEQAGATVIRHGGNKGYGHAVQNGFRYAKNKKFGAMVILDGDGQHDPRHIPLVVDPIYSGNADISIGSRFLTRGNHNLNSLYLIDYIIQVQFPELFRCWLASLLVPAPELIVGVQHLV